MKILLGNETGFVVYVYAERDLNQRKCIFHLYKKSPPKPPSGKIINKTKVSPNEILKIIMPDDFIAVVHKYFSITCDKFKKSDGTVVIKLRIVN